MDYPALFHKHHMGITAAADVLPAVATLVAIGSGSVPLSVFGILGLAAGRMGTGAALKVEDWIEPELDRQGVGIIKGGTIVRRTQVATYAAVTSATLAFAVAGSYLMPLADNPFSPTQPVPAQKIVQPAAP